MRAGTALAILSTMSPDMMQSIGSQMPAGVHLVDAPLIRGVRYAAEPRSRCCWLVPRKRWH